jgi:chorismate mutase
MVYIEEIRPHREKIDRLNIEIIEKIAERQKEALLIGEIKKKYDKPIIDTSREKVILESIREKAQHYMLDSDALERVFKEIIRLCVEAEEKQ